MQPNGENKAAQSSRRVSTAVNERKWILIFSILMIAVGMFCAAVVTIVILYQVVLDGEREKLVEIAAGQAHYMEAIAQLDVTYSEGNNTGGIRKYPLAHFAAASENYQGFGETGELVVARREGDQIVFLFPYRYGDGRDPDPIPWESTLAEPMRLALMGQEGALIDLDYRGERVLAAYYPVSTLSLGVVAKADMVELQAPFVMAALIAGGATLLMVLIGSGLTLRFTDPLVRQLQESEQRFRTIYENAPVLINAFDEKGCCLLWNKQCRKTFGWTIGEINAGDDSLALFYPDPAVRDEVQRSINSDPSGRFRKWHPVTKDGKTLTTMWANFRLPGGMVFSLGHDITKRVQAEGKLAVINRIISRSPAVVFLWQNAEGWPVEFVSNNVEDVFGYSAEDFMTQKVSFGEIVHLDDRERIGEEVARYSRDSVRTNFVHEPYRIITKSGRTIWIDDRTRIQRDKNGSITHYQSIVLDVTARKQAEEQATRLNRVLEGSLNEIYIFDAETLNFIEVNKGGRENLGYTMEELRRLTPLDLEPEFSVESFEDLVKPLRAGERKKIQFSTVHQRKDGSRYPVEIHLQMVTDSSPAFIGFILDITERRAVDEERGRLQAAIEAASETIVITDTRGVIQYANPEFERVTGYTREEAVGGNPRILNSGEHDRAFYQNLWKTISRGKVWQGQLINKKKDGTLFYEEATISPIKNENGKIVNYVAVKRDVTQQRVLENQLHQAQKLESIGQLAAGIAHEINTPTQYVGDNTRFMRDSVGDLLRLIDEYGKVFASAKESGVSQEQITAIESVIDEIDLEFVKEEIPKAIEQTLDGVNRVADIVRAMKDFSHPGSEGKTPADLNKAIESTITVCRNRWKYVADLVTEFEDGLPMVPCLVGEFNQVVLNLVVNAADAIGGVVGDGGQGKGQITVSTRQDGGWVEIQVSDTGGGIPKGIQRKIFDPFFTTKEVGKGTGQGLAISHDVIVNKHGGTIEFKVNEGVGTTFTVRLPIEEQVVETQKDAA